MLIDAGIAADFILVISICTIRLSICIINIRIITSKPKLTYERNVLMSITCDMIRFMLNCKGGTFNREISVV